LRKHAERSIESLWVRIGDRMPKLLPFRLAGYVGTARAGRRDKQIKT
jgi:hypothetical protein